MGFIKLDGKWYNANNIVKMWDDNDYINFIFDTTETCRTKKHNTYSYNNDDYNYSESAVNYFNNEIKNNKDNKYELSLLQEKYEDIERKYYELDGAIKFLPIVTGEYNSAKTSFETR